MNKIRLIEIVNKGIWMPYFLARRAAFMMGRRIFLGLLLMFSFFLHWQDDALAANKEKSDYNLIMISLSNVGARHMSLYGYEKPTTPSLDKWSRGALVFENAFSCGSWTLPVATSLFTSLYPYAHGVVGRDIHNVLNKNILTLPEILRESGYKTAAFTGGLDYYRGFGHMRGFQEIDNNPNFSGFTTTLAQAQSWLSKNSGQKFFLFIHGYDTHCPFTPPDKFRGIFSNPSGKDVRVDNSRCVRGYRIDDDRGIYNAFYAGGCGGFRDLSMCKKTIPVQLTRDDIAYLTDLYDEEVLSVDSLIGEFLSSLDTALLKNTVIVIFSDHGEMFYKHGRFGRAGTVRGVLYDEVAHIPLMIKTPELKGRRVKGLAQIVDIVPTVLDILHILYRPRVQGKSLLPLMRGRHVNEYVYAGLPYNQALAIGPAEQYDILSINESIRNRHWKLIREVQFLKSGEAGRIHHEIFELYNLRDDPDELKNVYEKFPDIAGDLKDRLKSWVEEARAFETTESATERPPATLLEDAQSHGYW